MKKIFCLVFILILFPINAIAISAPSYLTLEKAIEIALVNSLELKSLEKEFDSAAASFEQAEKTKNQYKDANASAPTQQARLELHLVREGYYFELAKANLEMVRAKQKQFENKIIAEITQKFYAVLLSQKNLQLADDNLEYEKTKLNNLNEKFKVGMITKLDVLQGELAVTNAKNEIETAKNNLDLTKKSLCMSMGVDLTSSFAVADNLATLSMDVPLPIEIMADANNSNPNIIGARGNVKAAEIKQTETHSVFHSYSSQYDIATADYEKAKITKEQAEIGNILSIYSAYSSLLNANSNLDSANKMVEITALALKNATASYEIGLATVETVNSAEKAYSQSKIALEAAKSDFLIIKANYEILY